MSQALVNHQLPDNGLRDKTDNSARRHAPGAPIMESHLGVRHSEIRGVENPRGAAGSDNCFMHGRTVNDSGTARPSSGVPLMNERRGSGPPQELPLRDNVTSPAARNGYPLRDMPPRDVRNGEFPTGNSSARESQLCSSREGGLPPRDIPQRDYRDGSFPGNIPQREDSICYGFPAPNISRRDSRDGGVSSQEMPQRDSRGDGLPPRSVPARGSRDGGFPPQDSQQRDSRDGGLPPQKLPERSSRNSGIPPRILPPRDSKEGGLPQGDAPRLDSRNVGPRDIPRRGSIDGGLPSQNAPRRDSRDNGFPPRDIPQRDSRDGGIRPRDLPGRLSREGGLPQGDAPERDSRDGGFRRDDPRQESADGGLPPRDLPRRDSIGGGLPPQDVPLRNSRDGRLLSRDMPLRESRQGGLPPRTLPPWDSREGTSHLRDTPQRGSRDGVLPQDIHSRGSMDGDLPAKDVSLHHSRDGDLSSRNTPLGGSREAGLHTRNLLQRDSREGVLPHRDLPRRDSVDGGFPSRDMARKDSMDDGLPPQDMPRRDLRDGGLPPRDVPQRDSRHSAGPSRDTPLRESSTYVPQGDIPPRDSTKRVFSEKDVRQPTAEDQRSPSRMRPPHATDARGSKEGMHSQVVVPHDVAPRSSHDGGHPPRDLRPREALPPRNVPLSQDFRNDGFPRDIPARSFRDSGVLVQELPQRDAPVRESLEMRGVPSLPRESPLAGKKEPLSSAPPHLLTESSSASQDNVAPPFASSSPLSDSLASSRKVYAQPPRVLPPRELPPRELPAPDSYAGLNTSPTRQFQPRELKGPTPFDEADDQAGDLPDFVSLELASSKNDENAPHASSSPSRDNPEQQNEHQHQFKHRVPPPPSTIGDIPAPQSSEPVQPRTRPVPSIIGSQVIPDISTKGALPKLPRSLPPPDSNRTLDASQKHRAPSGEDSENDESLSEHSLEEQIAVEEDDPVYAVDAADTVDAAQLADSQHADNYQVRSQASGRQLLVDSDGFDCYDPVAGVALTEDEIAEEEPSSPLQANLIEERKGETRWSAMGFMQHRLRKTFFGEDSRVIPMCNSMIVENSRLPGKHGHVEDDPFSCPPRPNPLMPQEFTWDAFMDKKLRHLDLAPAKIQERSLKSLHDAIDLIPNPDWHTMPPSVKKAFLMQPLPGRDVCVQDGRNLAIHAQLIRTKGRGFSGKFFPTYSLLVGYAGQQHVLLAAQKATGMKAKTPYYILSTDPNCFVKGSDSYLGKLRSNWLSTEYTCFGTGKNPKKETVAEQNREELLAVKFTKPGNAPRRMEVILPMVHPNGSREMWRPTSEKDSLMAQTGSGESSSFIRYVSKLPTWDAKRQTFTINFHGRVRHASSKNFQLIDAHGSNEGLPVVQFGRWDSNKFNLDAAYPFSILQAFSAALTTFDARTLESFKMTY